MDYYTIFDNFRAGFGKSKAIDQTAQNVILADFSHAQSRLWLIGN